MEVSVVYTFLVRKGNGISAGRRQEWDFGDVVSLSLDLGFDPGYL
jgi:hypothetical protein